MFLLFYFKIESIPLDTDPNWAKILDPDPNSMYSMYPQHLLRELQAVQTDGQTITAHDSIAVGFECD